MTDPPKNIQFGDETKPVRSNRSNGLSFGDVLAESKVSQVATSYDFEEKALEIAHDDLNKKKKQVCILPRLDRRDHLGSSSFLMLEVLTLALYSF